MTIIWPWLLTLLILPAAIIGWYIWMLRRRKRFAVSYSTLSLIQAALPKRSRWRQHLPFALFVFAVTCMVFALARPAALINVPLNRTTIVLALDVSRSMCAIDVEPNRLTVAQEAILAFIDDQPAGTQLGLVAFAGFAEIVVPPTDDKEQLRAAVANLTTSLGTAIGSATLKSIDAIAEINPNVEPSGIDLRSGGQELELEEGVYAPDIVVLLTDGANSRGPLPIEAASQAADRQVRVYTIGFGTDDPIQMVCTQAQMGADTFGIGSGRENFGGGGFGGGGGGGFGDFRRFLVIDEATLQTVADMTGGAYYRAENASQLVDVFLDLPSQIVLQREKVEISFAFVALAAASIMTAVWLSLRWNRYA